jgi:hypothetical protein
MLKVQARESVAISLRIAPDSELFHVTNIVSFEIGMSF